jgi:Ca-activated chloride channel family protein
MGMSFANPQFLWLVLALLVLSYLGRAFSLYRQKKLGEWIAPSLWPSIIPEYSKRIFNLKYLFLALTFFFLSICLSRPQWGEREEIIQSQGMDILFLLDLSNSMWAEDVPPSRLGRAQTFIKKMLLQLADDRVGIVGFAGSAQLAVPLTTDFQYVAEMVDTLDPNAISNQGTDIGAAIDVGIKAFERGAEDDHKTSRAFILISDGEDFGDAAIKDAQRLKDFGAGFFTLSVGTSEGAPIALRNEAGILQTYKKDLNGKPILTRVNKEYMKKIADAGGGTYVDLVNADDAANAVTRQLLNYNRSSRKDQRQITKIDRYQWFLLLAILSFLIHLSLGYQPLSSTKKKKATTLASILLLFLFSSRAQAQTFDSYLKSRQATQEYEKQDFDSAAKSFEAARQNDPQNPTLPFNEGTAFAKGNHPEDAISSFQTSSKQALSQGDYATAAKSLYNEGIVQGQQKKLPESYDRLTKAIEMARISNQPELEKKAREALVKMVDQQKQQSKEDEEKKKQEKEGQGKDGQQPKDQNGQGQSGNQKDQQKNGQGDKNKQNPTGVEGKREFKSGTLSKDTAVSIMNDLSDREKQLYQRRLKEQRPRETTHDKDW